MAINARVGGAWRTITGGKVVIGGVYRTIRRVLVATGGEWKEVAVFASPLAVSVNNNASGSVESGGRATVTTNTVTATVTGGLGPYSYAWLITSSDNGVVSISNAAFKATNFARSMFNEITNAQASITITDSLGQTAVAGVAITLQHEFNPEGA